MSSLTRVCLLIILLWVGKGATMEKMDTATMITNIYVDACKKVMRVGGSKEEAKKAGRDAVFKAGYYLKNGKWIRGRGEVKKTPAFKNRADENKALASMIKSTPKAV